MRKQEEIKKVIWEFLAEYDKDSGDPAVDWAFMLQHRLAQKGVVIKVDIKAEPYPAELRVCEYFEPLIED